MPVPGSHKSLIAAAFAALVLSGCSGKAPPGKTEATRRPVAVRTVSVMQENVQRTTIQPATVHPFYRADIRARSSGYVKQVRADIGDFVQAGAILAVIDVPDIAKQREIMEVRITRHQSEEKRATAGVQLAKANIRSAEAKLAQARSQVRGAEALLAAKEAEFARTRDLVQRQSLESRMLDEARKTRDSAVANKQALESAINSAAADVAVAEAETVSAEADLEAAEAETSIARRQLEELDVMLAYATLKAPFAGIVTHRAVDPGDLVREENEVGKGEPLFVVCQLEKVRVQIPVPEADAALVRRGDAVSLNFPSFPGEQPLAAAVSRLAGDLDPSTRTMLVEVDVPNPDKKLIPGMFGQATITLATKTAANMLPARAIRFDEPGQAYVYIVEDDETVTVVPVTTGIDNGKFIEVTAGVKPGQRVVDAHLKRFTTGQKVTVVQR